jgi:hypothetical protein
VLARSGPLPSTALSVFSVTKAADGSATISATGGDIAVPSWTMPPNAPQAGSDKAIDTGDGRLPQAVSAVDPARGGGVGIWTAHAVAGGAGSMVRWYELDPVRRTVMQTGTLASPTTDYFNPAISPDRRVNGSSAQYGSSMVLLANSSSSAQPVSLVMQRKRGTYAASSPVTLAASPGPHVAFDCDSLSSTTWCRWGDYASASPDPASSVGAASGAVWSSEPLSSGSPIEELANWTSWNAVVSP